MGLSEVRKMGQAIVEKENGDLRCRKGETPGQRGLGFIIKNTIKHLVHEVIGVSDTIIVLTITMKRTKTTLTQVYAPTKNKKAL